MLGKPRYPSPPDWDKLASAIDSDPRRFLFVHQYSTGEWAKDRGERVTRLSYWGACQVSRPGTTAGLASELHLPPS